MNKIYIVILISIGLLFTSCSKRSKHYYNKKSNTKPKTYSESTSVYNSTISKQEYKYAKMNPYNVLGARYYPKIVEVGDVFNGVASWYGPDFHDELTANGETYNMHAMTAAHKTLPMNTVLKVTNRVNGLTTVVRVNDRGPFVGTRIIDLSNAAARKIDMVGSGTASVKLEVLGFYSKTIVMKPTLIKAPSNEVPVGYSYALQIASFTNIDGALEVQEEYDGTDGYKTIIKDIEVENGRLFKVYLKGFKTEKEIREYKENKGFINAFIVKDY